MNELKLIFTQICSTVYSLYSKGMTHGDIKPSNIMIKKDKIINMQKDLLDGKFDSVERFVESSSRITERKKGIGAFLANMFSDNKQVNREDEQ